MKQEMKRILILLLCAMLMISMMPASVFAEDEISETNAEQVVEEDVVEEVVEEVPEEMPLEEPEEAPEETAVEVPEEIASEEETETEAETEAEAIEEVSQQEAIESEEEISEPEEATTEEAKAEEKETEESEKDAEEAEESEEAPVAFDESKTIDGIKITVKAEEGAFPAGSTLSVRKVTASEEKKAEAAVEAERDENANVATSYTFDIKVLDKDGNEIQPAEGKKVEVLFKAEEIANQNLETSVYHIKEEGVLVAESLDTTEKGDIVSAETDGFSYYTVEFTYNSLTYNLDGNSEVALSDILDAVGLVGTATAAVSSDSEVIEVVEEEGNFTIKSKKFFTESKTLTVTIDGTDYEITVTGPTDFTQIDNSDIWWKFDSETGTLTVTGSGPLPDFGYTAKPASWKSPWNSIRSQVLKIEFAEDSNITSIGQHAFIGFRYITSIEIPKTVTSIGQYAFYRVPAYKCTDLKSVIFEEGSVCTSIGNFAFQSLTNLEHIDLPDGLETIGKSAFDGTTNLQEEIVFPKTILSIGEKAFNNSGITGVRFSPDSDPILDIYVFSACTQLETVDMGGTTSIKAYDFYRCTALKTFIGEEVRTMGHCSLSKNSFDAPRLSLLRLPKLESFTDDWAFNSTFADAAAIGPKILENSAHSEFVGSMLANLITNLNVNSDYTVELKPFIESKGTYTGQLFEATLKDPQGNIVNSDEWYYSWPNGSTYKYPDLSIYPDDRYEIAGRSYIEGWKYGISSSAVEVKCFAWRFGNDGMIEITETASYPVEKASDHPLEALHQNFDDLSVIMFKGETSIAVKSLLGRASVPGMDSTLVEMISPGEWEKDPEKPEGETIYYVKITNPESSDSSIVSAASSEGVGKECKFIANKVGSTSINFRMITAAINLISDESPIYGRAATRSVAKVEEAQAANPGPSDPFELRVHVIDAKTQDITQTSITLVLEGVNEEIGSITCTLGGQTLIATPDNMTLTFTGLKPDTEYSISLKTADNATGVITNGFKDINTRTLPKEDQEKPNAPTAKTIGTNSIELNTIENGLYRLGEDGKWQDSPVFEGLEMDTEYVFYQKIAGDDVHNESPVSDSATFRTSKHIHEWSYAAEGATITATCGNSDELHEGELTSTLTVVKPALEVYGGEESEEATLDGGIDGVSNPDIVYKKGNDVLDAAPKDVGTYTANITLGDVTASVEYTIAKADAPTLEEGQKPTAADLTYNGNDQDLLIAASNPLPTTHTMMYAVGEDGENAPSEDKFAGTIPTGKNAGKYYVWYYAKGDDNHKSTEPVCIEVTIAKKVATLSWTDTTFTYDGEEHKPTATVTNLETGDSCNVTVTGEQTDTNIKTKTDNYTATASALNNDNYQLPENKTAEFTITPKEITVSNITAQDKTYDGNTDATLVYTDAVLDGMVENDDLSVNATGTFADKNVGTDKTVTISGLTLTGDAKDNYVLATSDQQEETKASITKREITVSGIKSEGKTYDGNNIATDSLYYEDAILAGKVDGDGEYCDDELGITATGTFPNEDYGVDKVITLVGLTLTGSEMNNYVLATTGQQETCLGDIDKYAVTVTAIDATKVYGEDDPEFEFTYTPELIEGDTFEGTLSRHEGEEVGEYTITAGTLHDHNHNYAITYNHAKLTITQASNSATVSIEGWTYGDTPNSPTTTADFGAVTATYTYSNAKEGTYSETVPTNAGTYYVKATIPGTTNYAGAESEPVEFVIAQKEVGLDWSNSSLTYTGENQAPTATATNLVTNDTCTVTVDGAKKDTNIKSGVTSYTATATELNNSNYKLPENKTQNFTIAPKEITVSGIEADDKTYDQSADAELNLGAVVLAGKVENDNIDVSAKGQFADANAGMFKKVTISDLTLTGDDKDNYILAAEGQQTEAEASIRAKYVKVQAINSSKIYGQDDPTLEYTAEDLLPGDSYTGELHRDHGENVGTYGISQGGLTAGNNYSIEFTTALLTITQATENSVTVEIEGWTYGDAPNAPKATATFGQETATFTYSDAQDGDFTANVPENAGAWYVKATVPSTDNYVGAESDAVKFEIAKKEISKGMLTINPDTIKADGEEKSPEIVMKDGDAEMVEGTDYVVTGDAKTDKVGTHFITIEGQGNYTGSFETSWEMYSERTSYQKEEAEGGRGELEIFVDIEGNTENVTVDNLTTDVAKTFLSEEELARYNAGEHVLIYVELFEEDKATADATEKELLAKKFKEIGAEDIRWFDISVWKKIGNDAAEQVHDIKTAIEMTIEVPAEHQNAEEGYTRTFYFGRAHDGEAEVIAETNEIKVKFSSDKFSTYALGFKDAENKKEEAETEEEGKGESAADDETGPLNGETGTLTETSNLISGDTNPKTGDESNIPMWIGFALAAAVLALAVRRQYK